MPTDQTPEYVPARPIHSAKQVLDVSEITIGGHYLLRGRLNTRIVVTKAPYYLKDGSLCIDFQTLGRGSLTRIALADFAVIPHPHGFWNNVNWIEHT